MAHLLIKQLGHLQLGRTKLSRLLTTGNSLNGQAATKHAPAEQNDDFKVRDVIHGYKHERVESIKGFAIKPYHLKHQATGAEHLHSIHKDDATNSVFTFSLRTPPESLTGTVHLTKQPALRGSKNYAIEDASSKMPTKSPATYIDAMTGPDFTVGPSSGENNAADPSQLDRIADIMTSHLPRFFNQPHPFNLYTRDVVLIDNIRSVRIQGTNQYASRVALIKLYYALRYSNQKVEILNLVKLPEESCIKIRWRVIARPGLAQFLIYAFKFHSAQIWTDGISTLHIDKDGKIYCHVVDNIDIDQEGVKIKKVKNHLVNRGLSV